MRKLTLYPGASIAAVLLLLSGCAGPLTMNKIRHVEQGMPSKSLSSMVGRKPTKAFTVIDPESNLKYQVQIFPMMTGTATAYSVTYSEGVYVAIPFTIPVSDNFAFLFYEDSLLFWGFPHEYSRSDEQSIRRLAPLIVEALEKGK